MSTAALSMLCATPALAQNGQGNDGAVSREIVQPLPSADEARLNSALRRLSRNSRNLSALTDAGKAALALGDLEAAMGFFGRAQDLSPSNPAVKMGIAAVFLRSDRPIEALRLFSEAEAAGASSDAVAAERGLAFDLVGNNTEAQASYLVAMQRGAGSQVQRRLAISHAIAGNKEDFEIILKPLVAQRDFAAFRARAFGLAIMGEVGEANAIADAVMPRDLAARMAPYFEYMPRLTKSQQAAAANLGIFPRAAEIGRDDPRIAQYSGSTSVAGADARLAPQGAPLDRANTDPRRRRPDRTGAGSALVAASSAPPTATVAAAPPVSAAAAPTVSPGQGTAELPAVAETALAVVTPAVSTPVASAQSVSTPSATTPSTTLATVTQPSAAAPSITTFVSKPVEQVVEKAPALAASAPAIAVPEASISDAPAAETAEIVQTVKPAIVSAAEAVQPSDTKPQPSATTFDLAKLPDTAETAPTAQVAAVSASAAPMPASAPVPEPAAIIPAAAQPTETQSAATPIVQAVPEPRQRVADAFADFASEGRTSVAPAAGAVDISTLSVKRDVEETPDAETESKPDQPANPKRFWVQIATGQDRTALKFDYRRIARNAGGLLKNYAGHTAEWGETNRLVAGPVASSKAAQALVTALKEKGVDSFTFTSPEGKEVTEIK
ncbi:MAG: SPOR domain-containing protein [Marinomonas sp.]